MFPLPLVLAHRIVKRWMPSEKINRQAFFLTASAGHGEI
jgi:hypothetical protein